MPFWGVFADGARVGLRPVRVCVRKFPIGKFFRIFFLVQRVRAESPAYGTAHGRKPSIDLTGPDGGDYGAKHRHRQWVPTLRQMDTVGVANLGTSGGNAYWLIDLRLTGGVTGCAALGVAWNCGEAGATCGGHADLDTDEMRLVRSLSSAMVKQIRLSLPEPCMVRLGRVPIGSVRLISVASTCWLNIYDVPIPCGDSGNMQWVVGACVVITGEP